MTYARPRTLSEAVAALAGSQALLLAGGTDIYPSHVGRPLHSDIIDISAIGGLRGIAETADRIVIGGGTTWTDIIRAPLPPAFDALKSAAREVGSVQIQNRGTLAGNLCNASPAADGVPPLLVLDAEVELVSKAGKRVLKLPSFFTGYRKTRLRPGELLSAVLVPKHLACAGSAFVKLGARRYLVISIVMAAAVVKVEAGRITEARIAVGSASAVAQRLPALEKALAGHALDHPPSSAVTAGHLASLTPIDDVRATAQYRLDAAHELVGRVLDLAAGAGAIG